MRVLLGAAMVAGASAGLVGVGEQYTIVNNAAAADAQGPDWPATVTAVAAANDVIFENAAKAIETALDFKDADAKAAPKYADAAAEFKKLETQCGVTTALFTTAFKDVTEADMTLFNTNLKAAQAAYADEVLGQCKKTGSTATDGTEFYAVGDDSDNKTACEVADKADKDGAGNSSAGTWEPKNTSAVNETETGKLVDANIAEVATVCAFKKGSAALKSLEFWSGRTLTAAELEGVWPTPAPASTTDTSAADGSADGSAASPAYALAAGAAAALALLL